jgi:hypothetical protein
MATIRITVLGLTLSMCLGLSLVACTGARSRQEALDTFRRHYDRRDKPFPEIIVIDLEFVARFDSAAIYYGHMGGASSLLQVVAIESAEIPAGY